MEILRKLTKQYKSLTWLMIFTILAATLLPVHFHKHHVQIEDLSHHEHAFDMHFTHEKSDLSHHDENLQTLTASPDGLIKKVTTLFTTMIMLALLLALLPIVTSRHLLHTGFDIVSLKRNYLRFSPPLRAPPSH